MLKNLLIKTKSYYGRVIDINYRILKESITKEEIGEELYYIEGSKGFYITKSIKIYKSTDKGFYLMSQRVNKRNGYVYCSIKYHSNYKLATKRVHRVVALTFIHNNNPERKLVVGHKNNIKHDNRIENLYWTTTQENTKKAFDDKLNVQPKGIDNEYSTPILVTDLENNIVAVYGGIREACRMISNLNISYLNKTARKYGEDYKPRNKKYKYFKISKEQYINYNNSYKNIQLSETNPSIKQYRIFKAINLNTGEEYISDNQKQFAKEHGLKQASISHALINNTIYDNWKFKTVKDINYIESSCYEKLIDTYDTITIKHIETEEELMFDNPKKLKDHFGIVGHDIKQYINRGNLIFSKWKIVKVNDKLIA